MKKRKFWIRISTAVIGTALATQLIAGACGANYANIIPTDITKTLNNTQKCQTQAKSDLAKQLMDLFRSKNAQTCNKQTAPTKSTAPTAPKSGTTATKAPPVTATTDFAAFQSKVIELVNAERAKAGLAPLAADSALNNMATVKSQDMATNNYFDHTSPKYGSPFDMMRTFGISYRAAGENIAMGQTSPEQVMNGWMNSPGHRANILNSSFTKIGVGVAKNSAGRIYWTQEFIG